MTRPKGAKNKPKVAASVVEKSKEQKPLNVVEKLLNGQPEVELIPEPSNPGQNPSSEKGNNPQSPVDSTIKTPSGLIMTDADISVFVGGNVQIASNVVLSKIGRKNEIVTDVEAKRIGDSGVPVFRQLFIDGKLSPIVIFLGTVAAVVGSKVDLSRVKSLFLKKTKEPENAPSGNMGVMQTDGGKSGADKAGKEPGQSGTV